MLDKSVNGPYARRATVLLPAHDFWAETDCSASRVYKAFYVSDAVGSPELRVHYPASLDQLSKLGHRGIEWGTSTFTWKGAIYGLKQGPTPSLCSPVPTRKRDEPAN